MLSRVAHRLAQPAARPLAIAVRASGSGGGQRDEVNFPRMKRAIEPGKVRMGFVPEEWFTFFHKKTGVTGPYMFGTGLATWLVSKEIYVLDHEYYVGLSLLIMVIYGVKKFGPPLAKFLDKEIDDHERGWESSRTNELAALKEAIENEKLEQWRSEAQSMIVEAKRENVQLQLEATYRERLMMAYRQVKHRLDYQVEKQNIDRRISQKHMVQWIVNNVLKSITPDQEKETLNKCIADLGLLASKQ